MVKFSAIWGLGLLGKMAFICSRLGSPNATVDQSQSELKIDDVIDDHVTVNQDDKSGGNSDGIFDQDSITRRYVWGKRLKRSVNKANKKKCFDACENETESNQCESDIDNWLVQRDNNWDYDAGYHVLFGLFYIVFLLYLFVGVSIVSDKFMEAIEVVTAQVSHFLVSPLCQTNIKKAKSKVLDPIVLCL